MKKLSNFGGILGNKNDSEFGGNSSNIKILQKCMKFTNININKQVGLDLRSKEREKIRINEYVKL